MVTVSSRVVRQVLRERILSIDGVVPQERWAFQNRPSTVPSTSGALNKEDALWIQEVFGITAENRISTNEVQVFGRARYIIAAALDHGTEASEDMATLIAGDLQGVAYLKSQGVTIYLEQPARQPPFSDDGWWFLPVEVSWRAFTFETQQAS